MLRDIRSWMEKGPTVQTTHRAPVADLPPLFDRLPVANAERKPRVFSPAFKSQRLRHLDGSAPQHVPQKLTPKRLSIFDAPKPEAKVLTGRQKLFSILRD